MITHQLNRWIGWAGVLIGVASILVVAVTGPRIDSGFSPTFLAAMLWMLVASVVWGFSRKSSRTRPRVDDLTRS
jgi:drug/metabolite transporter (DMT)-like permease